MKSKIQTYTDIWIIFGDGLLFISNLVVFCVLGGRVGQDGVGGVTRDMAVQFYGCTDLLYEQRAVSAVQICCMNNELSRRAGTFWVKYSVPDLPD